MPPRLVVCRRVPEFGGVERATGLGGRRIMTFPALVMGFGVINLSSRGGFIGEVGADGVNLAFQAFRLEREERYIAMMDLID